MNAITVHSPHGGSPPAPSGAGAQLSNSGGSDTTSNQSQQAEKFEVFIGKSSKEAEFVKDGAKILIW